jgi:hypothetical protein
MITKKAPEKSIPILMAEFPIAYPYVVLVIKTEQVNPRNVR